jgi:hypothetical protein
MNLVFEFNINNLKGEMNFNFNFIEQTKID